MRTLDNIFLNNKGIFNNLCNSYSHMSKYSQLDSKETSHGMKLLILKVVTNKHSVHVGHISLDYRISEVQINSSDPIITIYNLLPVIWFLS